MASSNAQQQARIDALMEQAGKALVDRRYFECERLAGEALRRAYAINDYDRLARIVLPLQEARRQKRDMALEAAMGGAVFLVNGEIPSGPALVPGCYLVAPPRVGVDGRALREAADLLEVPAIVVVREPTSLDGRWPIVAVGPVTVRTKVPAPVVHAEPVIGKSKKSLRKPAALPETSQTGTTTAPPPALPDPKWFITANEALGDAAIISATVKPSLFQHVESLVEHLAAHPDHEKLHQKLGECARMAAQEPAAARRPPPGSNGEFEGEDNEDGDAA